MATPASPTLKRKRAARNVSSSPSRQTRHGHLMEGITPLHIGGVPQLDKMSEGFFGSMYEAMPIRASGINGPFIASNDISNSGIYTDRNGLHLAGTTGTTGFIQFYSTGWVVKGKIYYRDSNPNALHFHVVDDEDIVFRLGGTGTIGFVASGYTMGSTARPLGQLHVDKVVGRSIEFDDDESAPNIPDNSVPYVYRDNVGDLYLNALTGKQLQFHINGTAIIDVRSGELNLRGNNLEDVDTINNALASQVYIGTHLVPDVDITIDLGNNSKAFRTAYIQTIDDETGQTHDVTVLAKIYTGSYTGDGSQSQGISGLGFRPKYIRIWQRETTPGNEIWIGETTAEIMDDDASKGFVVLFQDTGGTEGMFNDDGIIALGADGFTVDDNNSDSHPNKNTAVYNYMALG